MWWFAKCECGNWFLKKNGKCRLCLAEDKAEKDIEEKEKKDVTDQYWTPAASKLGTVCHDCGGYIPKSKPHVCAERPFNSTVSRDDGSDFVTPFLLGSMLSRDESYTSNHQIEPGLEESKDLFSGGSSGGGGAEGSFSSDNESESSESSSDFGSSDCGGGDCGGGGSD